MPRKPPLTDHYKNILDILAEHGPITDLSGLVVPKLMELTGHESSNALSKILRRMEEYGMIRRHVRGTRTFAVGLPDQLTEDGELAPEPVATMDEDDRMALFTDEDMEVLAGVLLRKVLTNMNASDQAAANTTKVKQLEQALRAAAADLRALEAENAALREQLDEAREQALAAEKNVSVLMGQLDKPRRGESTIREMLSPATIKELDKLMREIPARRG